MQLSFIYISDYLRGLRLTAALRSIASSSSSSLDDTAFRVFFLPPAFFGFAAGAAVGVGSLAAAAELTGAGAGLPNSLCTTTLSSSLSLSSAAGFFVSLARDRPPMSPRTPPLRLAVSFSNSSLASAVSSNPADAA